MTQCSDLAIEQTVLQVLVRRFRHGKQHRPLSALSQMVDLLSKFIVSKKIAVTDTAFGEDHLNKLVADLAGMLPPVTFVLARSYRRRFKPGFVALSFKIFSASHPERLSPVSISSLSHFLLSPSRKKIKKSL